MQLKDGGPDTAPATASAFAPEDRFLLQHAGSALHAMAASEDRPRPVSELTLGLAVSGGSDSMAMLQVMALAAGRCGWKLRAATVDHRLRPEATDEAHFVARTCAALGIPHDILIWDDHPSTGNMHDAARKGRYRLLAAWAEQHRIGHIAIAHTADDQAETFLMGLSRAAGLEGLSGMRPAWEQAGIRFHRPFLTQSREALRDHLRRRGLPWRDDPSNEMDRYSRTKARHALKALAPLGITSERLNESLSNLAQVSSLLRQITADCVASLFREEAGALRVPAADFYGQHPEMQRRLLVTAIRWLSGAPHPPRAGAVRSLQAAMMQDQRTATLGGCRFGKPGGAGLSSGEILITREARAVAGPAPFHPGMVWDHRWILTGPDQPGLEVRALGATGLAQLKDWRESGLRRETVIVTPALWQADRLISAPVLQQNVGEWGATLYPSFGSFILSH